MKTKICLIIEKDGKKILVSGKKTSIFSFPVTRIRVDEQPEDSIHRVMDNSFGVLEGFKVSIVDAINYGRGDHKDDRSLFLIFKIILDDNVKIKLNEKFYGKYIWRSDVAGDNLDDFSGLIFDMISGVPDTYLEAVNNKKYQNEDFLTIFSDGGSRGNPGPSASAFVLIYNNKVIEEGGEYIGITTNGIAEYRGVYLGLKRAYSLGYKNVQCKIDNMMVVNQMNGNYLIKNRELWPVFDSMNKLVSKFDSVKFTHVKREFNAVSDGLVNKILDEHEQNDI